MSNKKRFILPIYSIIATALSGLIFGGYCLIKGLANRGTYVYLFGVSSTEIAPVIVYIAMFLIISAVAILFYKNTKHKTLAVLLITAVMLLSFSYTLLDLTFSADSDYYEFTSDDKSHSIVVREWSFLLGGGGSVYEKTSDYTMKYLNSYGTDDGFCPIRNERYYFVWNENDFELHYDFGNGSEYEVLKTEYLED